MRSTSDDSGQILDRGHSIIRNKEKYFFHHFVEKYTLIYAMQEKAQRIVVFIESNPISTQTPHKIATSTINRFAIDEHAAFDIDGIHYVPFGYNTFTAAFNDAIESLEIIARKISIRGLEFSGSDESGLHLIFALNEYQHFSDCSLMTTKWNDFRSMTQQKYAWIMLLRILKKPSVMMSFFMMIRGHLITKEKMEGYPEGRENLKQSFYDDLDDFVVKVRLGKTIEPRSRTYYLPRLTEKEKNLVECRDTSFMRTLMDNNPDRILRHMKTSESNSMYLT